MKVGEINGFDFHVPISGGKAGFGCNKTSTIQVRKNNTIVKQFRFDMDSQESRTKAIKKAKAYAEANK